MQEYQHRYSSRVRQVYVSGLTLLLAASTFAVLIVALAANIIDRTASLSVTATYAGTLVGVASITYLLAQIYLHSRDSARQARAWLDELEAFRGSTVPDAEH